MNGSLVEMFRYNNWANETLFAACEGIGDDALDSVGAGTSGSIRELLWHIAGGQQTQLMRTRGEQSWAGARGDAWPGFDEVLSVLRASGEGLVDAAAKVSDDDATLLSYQGKRWSFPVRFILAHAIHHAIEHRTEVKVALNQIGIVTPDLDGWSYATAAGYGEEVS